NKGNRFAYSPLCEGYEEFVLCRKDYEKELDEETFKERLEIYKKTKAEKEAKKAEEEKKEKESSKVFNSIIEFVEENLVVIIAIAIFAIVLVIGIILFVKRYMKRRRLE
ncbi:MAG: hypothetical protein IKI04_02470, partial [Bacilli bacterium]|nr:hypothetical protein [Bacilli bacterium]